MLLVVAYCRLQTGHIGTLQALVYTVEQLAQLQLEMEARCKRASSEHTRPTPRSSLDLSRLQVCAPSDYTASGRSSFETQVC